jgi:hypothetical protein
MPDETTLPTPAQVAQNEIAKQTVMLIFGIVTAVIVMKLQSRMVQQMSEHMREGGDPDAARTRRMQEARRLEQAWHKVASWTGALAMRAYRQADKARASYEKDRP